MDPQFTHEKIVLIHEKSTKALWVIWVCLATNTLNDSINLTKHLKFVCRQKSTSSFMFSLRYCKDIENLFSWVIWACLDRHTQKDTINLCVYLQVKNQLYSPCFSRDITKISNLLILGKLQCLSAC